MKLAIRDLIEPPQPGETKRDRVEKFVRTLQSANHKGRRPLGDALKTLGAITLTGLDIACTPDKNVRSERSRPVVEIETTAEATPSPDGERPAGGD